MSLINCVSACRGLCGIGLAATLVVASPAMAVTEVCFSVDGSGSISAPDFTLQLEGYAQAVENPTVVAQDGSVAVALVQFSSGATLEVPMTVIDSQATADSVAATIRAVTQQNLGTAFAPAIDLCVVQFGFAAGDTQVLDLSTDGANSDQAATLVSADNAVAAGVDAINAIGVGPGINTTNLEALVRPQPASTPPDPGFVVLASDFAAFADALADKIIAETGGGFEPPEPAPAASTFGLLLLAGLLGVFGWWRMRQA